MTVQFPERAVAFLRDLEAHNTKEWFQANKKRYETDLKEPARALVEAINDQIRLISPARASDTPHKNLNRINRDIRFSADKTPYNTHVWGGFTRGDRPRGQSAGLYFGLSLTGVGVGAGVWKPEKEQMVALRQHLADHHDRWVSITSDPSFTYTIRRDDALKRVPRPFAADHPAGEVLKLKTFHISQELGPELLTSPDLVPTLAAHFARLVPVVDFLDEGLFTG